MYKLFSYTRSLSFFIFEMAGIVLEHVHGFHRLEIDKFLPYKKHMVFIDLKYRYYFLRALLWFS